MEQKWLNGKRNKVLQLNPIAATSFLVVCAGCFFAIFFVPYPAVQSYLSQRNKRKVFIVTFALCSCQCCKLTALLNANGNFSFCSFLAVSSFQFFLPTFATMPHPIEHSISRSLSFDCLLFFFHCKHFM